MSKIPFDMGSWLGAVCLHEKAMEFADLDAVRLRGVRR